MEWRVLSKEIAIVFLKAAKEVTVIWIRQAGINSLGHFREGVPRPLTTAQIAIARASEMPRIFEQAHIRRNRKSNSKKLDLISNPDNITADLDFWGKHVFGFRHEHESLLQAVDSMFYDEVYQEEYNRTYPIEDPKIYIDEEYAATKHKEFLEHLLDVYLEQFGYSGASDPKLKGFENIFITKLYATPGGLRNLDEFIKVIARSKSPQEQLRFVNEVLRLVKEDGEIASIGAGAVENLFRNHCDEIYADLDQMIRTNPNMRKAIQIVWCSPESKLFEKLKTLLDKYGLKYNSF